MGGFSPPWFYYLMISNWLCPFVKKVRCVLVRYLHHPLIPLNWTELYPNFDIVLTLITSLLSVYLIVLIFCPSPNICLQLFMLLLFVSLFIPQRYNHILIKQYFYCTFFNISLIYECLLENTEQKKTHMKWVDWI